MLCHDTGMEPILYVSKESHYSNMRLADLQNMEVRLIDADSMGRMLPEALASRSALSPMKFWWIINEVGTEGFTRQAERMLSMARYLKDRLDLIGWPAWLGETSNTVFY